MEEVYEALLRRAHEAVAEADRQHGRARELAAFVRALRESGPADPPTLCAWCHRIAAAGHWIDPRPLLTDTLLDRLRATASHGICPGCYARVSAEAERQRQR